MIVDGGGGGGWSRGYRDSQWVERWMEREEGMGGQRIK